MQKYLQNITNKQEPEPQDKYEDIKEEDIQYYFDKEVHNGDDDDSWMSFDSTTLHNLDS